MGPVAILFGVLLCLLSGVLYPLSEVKSPTILIPAYFGIALIVLGVLARKEKLRKHVMHLAAGLGLVGLVIPAYRVVIALIVGKGLDLPMAGQIVMAVLCGVFLALCVRSFIKARRRRKENEQNSSEPRV